MAICRHSMMENRLANGLVIFLIVPYTHFDNKDFRHISSSAFNTESVLGGTDGTTVIIVMKSGVKGSQRSKTEKRKRGI
ncbi:hypothetical protein psyc5s11_05240 [Clostridium gelidum]|uniref:Uncharacterized protein n=1 Tax=Clostridium gelidum TaxID=704125 RepID=A0ABN6IR34_9CLOT|nr:hypothetical protein [Clostridium gelidum]BCZ44457.1 hypothetical protein psyc5s11_05240 [Clostridium gelidum]